MEVIHEQQLRKSARGAERQSARGGAGHLRAGAYQLLNTGTFPTLRIGKRLLVPKDKLIDWIEQNTGGGNGN